MAYAQALGPMVKLIVGCVPVQDNALDTGAGVAGVGPELRVIQLLVPIAQGLGLFETDVGNALLLQRW